MPDLTDLTDLTDLKANQSKFIVDLKAKYMSVRDIDVQQTIVAHLTKEYEDICGLDGAFSGAIGRADYSDEVQNCYRRAQKFLKTSVPKDSSSWISALEYGFDFIDDICKEHGGNALCLGDGLYSLQQYFPQTLVNLPLNVVLGCNDFRNSSNEYPKCFKMRMKTMIDFLNK